MLFISGGEHSTRDGEERAAMAMGIEVFGEIFQDGRMEGVDPRDFVRKVAPLAEPGVARLPGPGSAAPQPAPAVIDTIPDCGLVISQAGTYTLAKNVTWTPDADASAAISISADNVTLDLGGLELSVNPGAEDRQLSAVLVSQCTNVTVRNGSILNACFRGVSAEEVESLTVASVVVSGVTFRDIATRNCCPAGIFVYDSKTVEITGCQVNYMYVTSDVAAGIMTLLCGNVAVSQCSVTQLVNYDGSVQGICCYGSSGVTWTGCRASTLQSFFNGNIRTGGHTVLGFMPCLSAHVSVVQCSADTLIGSRDDCHGMSVFICFDVLVEQFRADTVVCGPAPYNTGAKATGLEVYGWRVQVFGSSATNIRATNPQDRQAAGFSAWGWGIAFADCTASAVGVSDAAGQWTPSLGYGVGYGWAPDPRPEFRSGTAIAVDYARCTAQNCQVGFDTWNHVKSAWIGTTATGCATEYLVQTDPPGTRTISADPASECNPPITVTLTNQAADNTLPGG
jgi:hypothetical protein